MYERAPYVASIQNEARVTKLSAIYREMHPHLVRRAA